MVRKISPDSTIKSVWPHLAHQRAYVSGVLDKMRECHAVHGNSSVKIGVTGTGQKPYYRIFFEQAVDGGAAIFGSYYDNHDPLEIAFAETNNWSSESMTLDEVLNFYADAIGYKGKRI